MAIANGLDGAQFSTPITVTTSAAVVVSFGFRANILFLRASTSAGCFVDLTNGLVTLATTSASYPIPAAGTLGPLFVPYKTGNWTGLSAIASVPTTLFPLALL